MAAPVNDGDMTSISDNINDREINENVNQTSIIDMLKWWH